MLDRNSNTFRLFEHYEHYDPPASERTVDEKCIGDFETIFILEDGSRILFDEMTKSTRFVTQATDERTPISEDIMDDIWLKEFSRKIKKKMKFKRITQVELADRIGVSRLTVNRYINGQRVPDYLTLKKISKILNCPLDEITDFWYLY